MAQTFRGILLASLSVSVLALTACGTTTDPNVTNRAEASRVDSILERAARDARASGNKVETVALLEQVHQRNPKDAAVATSYGQALREDEQLNRARQVLIPFTEGKEAYPDAVTELAMVELALGQYKEAELTSRRAVELDANSGRAYLALGTALDAQNYHEQAEIAFRRGLDKWKGDPAPMMNNLALNLASQNKLDQAIDMLKKAQEISPGRMELERNMRIITTLKEGADDFLIKQDNAKKAATVKPDPVKKEVVKTETKAPEKAQEKTKEDVANKQLPPKEKSDAPAKNASGKTTTKTAPEKIEPAASTNRNGSKQNFNSSSSND